MSGEPARRADPAAAIVAGLLRALARTWRIERGTPDELQAAIGRGTGCIFALWHARLLPLALLHRDLGAVVLISRHRDGERIARVVQRLGYRVARGSSTRGGEAGMRELLEAATRGVLLGITPDGPRGPRERVKPGLVFLASRSGLPVIPTAAAARPAWAFDSWDRFRVPTPFARVALRYGAPVAVPPGLDPEESEAWRVRLEEAIAAVARAASEQVEERP